MNILMFFSLRVILLFSKEVSTIVRIGEAMLRFCNGIWKLISIRSVAMVRFRYADKLYVSTKNLVSTETVLRADKKINVMQAIRQGEVGGGETHVLELISILDPKKYDLTVLCFSDGAMVRKLKSRNIKVFVIHTKKPFDFRVWTKVSELLKVNSIDILHVHGTRAFSNTFFSAKRCNIPVLYTVHGWSFHPDQSSLIHWFRVKSEKFLIQKADMTILVSQSDCLEGIRRFGEFGHKVIKNTVNLNQYNPYDVNPAFRKELGIGEDVFLVGFIARITKQKNLEVLLEAIKKTSSECKIILAVVGDGDLKDKMVDKVSELEITERVKFYDFRDDVSQFLSSIDVYCLPSLWEGLSIGLLEAMVMEKAVIVSNVQGNVELVKHLENGLVVDIDSDSIKDAIMELYLKPDLRMRLAANARRTILNDYDSKNMVQNIEDVYSQLLPYK